MVSPALHNDLESVEVGPVSGDPAAGLATGSRSCSATARDRCSRAVSGAWRRRRSESPAAASTSRSRIPPPTSSDSSPRAFEQMRLRLASLDRARGEFIANASHELRTPLFSLAGFLELLGTTTSTPRPGTSSSRHARQVERLTKLATDLLDLSRMDAGRLAQTRPSTSRSLADLLRPSSPRARGRLGHTIDLAVDPRVSAAATRHGASDGPDPRRERRHPHPSGHLGHPRAADGDAFGPTTARDPPGVAKRSSSASTASGPVCLGQRARPCDRTGARGADGCALRARVRAGLDPLHARLPALRRGTPAAVRLHESRMKSGRTCFHPVRASECRSGSSSSPRLPAPAVFSLPAWTAVGRGRSSARPSSSAAARSFLRPGDGGHLEARSRPRIQAAADLRAEKSGGRDDLLHLRPTPGSPSRRDPASSSRAPASSSPPRT